MPNAKKLPSGNWRVRAYDKTTGKYKSFTADTKKEAELMALEWMNGKQIKHSDLTFGYCIDDYIASKVNILSPSTIDSYRRISRNSLQPLHNYRLCELNQDIVQKHFNALAQNKSPKTVSNAHGLFISVMNVYAPELHLHTTLPKKKKIIKVLPSVDDVIGAIYGTDIELPCLMAIWLGMRMSEIRGVKKSDIHDGVIIINEVIITVDGKHITKNQTKTTESTRRIELPDYILKLIEKQPTEHLTELTGQAIYKRLSRILEKNNLPHISFHDLRHLNASTMLALGIPDKYAMERGGWSSTNIMKSVYQHTFTKERQLADMKIDAYFNEIMQKYDTKHDTDL
jgi:integrase